jgi:trans-aconitate methyltransferase
MTDLQKVHWAAQTYDESMAFVSRNGESLFEWLKPQAGERILDFGCGTGDLAAEISKSRADVVGMDISPEMIGRARNKYPNLAFYCADGTKWRPEHLFDAIFSNAALHWIKDAGAAVTTIKDSLVPGGRFIAEFGGRGNVQSVIDAFEGTLTRENRMDAFIMPWNFPSVGEYSSLLESHGFEVRIAMLTDRPTRLDGEDGMLKWLNMFGMALIPNTEPVHAEKWFSQVAERLRPTHYRGGYWMLEDYRRLRLLAMKAA